MSRETAPKTFESQDMPNLITLDDLDFESDDSGSESEQEQSPSAPPPHRFVQAKQVCRKITNFKLSPTTDCQNPNVFEQPEPAHVHNFQIDLGFNYFAAASFKGFKDTQHPY